VSADFLNNPQPNPSVAHRSRTGRSPKAVGGGSLDVGPLERFSQNLVRARRGANVSRGGKSGGREINNTISPKSCRAWLVPIECNPIRL
jgi:hypothetical protein